jgi:hypothetical protein
LLFGLLAGRHLRGWTVLAQQLPTISSVTDNIFRAGLTYQFSWIVRVD